MVDNGAGDIAVRDADAVAAFYRLWVSIVRELHQHKHCMSISIGSSFFLID